MANEVANDIILRVSGLVTKFHVGKRIVNAVNGVSFDVRRGKTLGIVGESGCGKSVMASSILQLLPSNGFIAGGSVEYISKQNKMHSILTYKPDGREMRMLRGKEISMIFQDPLVSLNPVYSIGDQIAENLRQHEHISKKDARKRIISFLSELGIPIPEKRFFEYPHQFSGGMKQRVMIAIAMICNPNILIADEPTTALDVTIQAQILELIHELQERYGMTVILITHNMGIVAETCDDVAIMYMGRIVEIGNLNQIFFSPLHPYTRALLRSVPVLGMQRGEKLESIRGTTPDAYEMFEGCEFAPRCDCVCDKCKRMPPPEAVSPDGHRVRCWMYEEGIRNE